MPKVRKVISLKNKADFLMHGVVLQNRVFRDAGAMFHVRHFCVKAAPAQFASSPDSRKTVAQGAP
jgi:hypothetical protein